jgi:GH25 family lysozyme M1 (1,4-beta-N-acetylmuramidase)
MTQFMYDVSNHQTSTPDLSGWAGLIAKASEGSGFRDGRFRQHRDNTMRQGKLFAAYHFLRSDAPVVDQVSTFLSVVGAEDPLIPDVESIKDRYDRVVSAPTLAQTREFIDRLRQKGRNVPVTYLPRWYWDFWGRPDIRDLPPIWPSRYPDYIARPREVGWAMVGPQPSFGNARMSGLVQFTSTPLDMNAFEGTYAQLAALLGGGKDNTMQPTDRIKLVSPGSVERGENPPYAEDHPLDWALSQAFFKGSDAYLQVARLTEIVERQSEEIAVLRTELNKVQTGGVSEERIGQIAKAAIGGDLTDDER